MSLLRARRFLDWTLKGPVLPRDLKRPVSTEDPWILDLCNLITTVLVGLF